MYEAINSKDVVYFSYKIFPRSGLTDQLDRLRLCYSLGTSLGYQYVHSPFDLPRTSNKLDEFLGFSDYFETKLNDLTSENAYLIEINLSHLFQERLFNSLDELQAYIKNNVANTDAKGKKIIVRFSLLRSSKEFLEIKPDKVDERSYFSKIYRKIYRFLWKKKRVGKLFRSNPKRQHPPAIKLSKWFDAKTTGRLDFRAIFFQTKKQKPWRSRFAKDKIKVLVHIRQGDVAVIETPWRTFIPLKKQNRKKTQFKEQTEITAAGDIYIHPEDYYVFLSQFMDDFDSSKLSIIVCSDGYKRGFKKIYTNLERYSFSAGQIDQLNSWEKSYNQKKFARFEELENCLCLVGETDENLFDLVYSALTADVIIIGTQMHMIPKLLKLFPRIYDPPILIVLHKDVRFKKGWDYPNLKPLNESNAKIISAKIGELDIKEIVANVHQQLENKKQTSRQL